MSVICECCCRLRDPFPPITGEDKQHWSYVQQVKHGDLTGTLSVTAGGGCPGGLLV